MQKTLMTPEEIVNALNSAMANSGALDGDCKECQVRRIGRVTEQEAGQLGRNWNVEMVNGECLGECMAVLTEVAKEVGRKLDASW
ncbi:hypothetical protein ATO7_06225 [Oceanococcus atlanticus]|uniref:Uncharacterized protein n=1 Tax=Oceanococcus atlanticus TaxID=1317117 RepID=A0A1Y1SIH3_9GAMM|nr:hypothetical protein [Oceanococcus atlanticus]ORE89454.1 hypothetical protein ATO7_06225 [Oceanococcus atlanticus]